MALDAKQLAWCRQLALVKMNVDRTLMRLRGRQPMLTSAKQLIDNLLMDMTPIFDDSELADVEAVVKASLLESDKSDRVTLLLSTVKQSEEFTVYDIMQRAQIKRTTGVAWIREALSENVIESVNDSKRGGRGCVNRYRLCVSPTELPKTVELARLKITDDDQRRIEKNVIVDRVHYRYKRIPGRKYLLTTPPKPGWKALVHRLEEPNLLLVQRLKSLDDPLIMQTACGFDVSKSHNTDREVTCPECKEQMS